MKKAILMVLTAAALVVTTTTAHAVDQVTFLLDWIPSGEEPYPYVAQKEGFFKDEGLEVTVRVGRGSTDTITKLGTGTAEFGAGAIGALMGAVAQNNVPVKGILSIYCKQPDAIFTVKGTGITTLKDLTGHTVATAPFTASNVIWPVFAKANGLDLTKITLFKADPNTLFGMLATGKTDATISWVTNKASAERVLTQGGKQLVILPWSDYGLEGYGLSLFATDKVIKEQPQLVARFLRAYTKAINFTFANPEAAAKDNHELIPDISAEDGLAEWKNAAPLIKNEVSEKYGMWTFNPELLKKTWEWVAKAQDYPLDKIDPVSTVDRSFIPKS
jgi:NitT/TauT family transport system substrate-binding protein